MEGTECQFLGSFKEARRYLEENGEEIYSVSRLETRNKFEKREDMT